MLELRSESRLPPGQRVCCVVDGDGALSAPTAQGTSRVHRGSATALAPPAWSSELEVRLVEAGAVDRSRGPLTPCPHFLSIVLLRTVTGRPGFHPDVRLQ